MPKKTSDPLADPQPIPSWMNSTSGGSDIWSGLQDQQNKVDSSFDTSSFDQAADEARGNITSASEESANAAAADYASRARQAGGNAEGAGLVKAEALVSGRREVEDVRLKQMQYDIAQKEGARQLASTIAGKIGDLRLGYLQNLTGWNETLQKDKTTLDVSAQDQSWHYAQIAEQSKEFGFLHPQITKNNPNYDPYYAEEGMPGGMMFGPGQSMGTPGQSPYYTQNWNQAGSNIWTGVG